MLALHISQADAETANYERISHPLAIIRKRFQAIWLLSQGCSREQAAQIAEASLSSVKNYIKIFHSQGAKGLSALKYKGPESALKGHRATLKAFFEQRPPRNSDEAADRIEELTGIRLRPGRVRISLHRLGMPARKTGHVPAKAGPEKQKEFLAGTLGPLIAQALNGECHLSFMDASHFPE